MNQVIRSEARFFDSLGGALFALENYHMRTIRLLGELYGLEPSAAVVFVTICLATAAPANGRAATAPPRFVSRLAIAQSVGLARETVRRKCAALAEAGLIENHGRRGVAVASGAALSEQDPAVLRQMLADAHKLIEGLFRLGVFAVVEDDPADNAQRRRAG